jgi:hypothetical protein
MEEHWEVVEMVQGQLQAEILRGLLEAQQVKVWLNQEGAGAAYGITVGPLGTVEILVPASELAQARKVLDAYYAGEFENTEMGPIAADADDLDDSSADDDSSVDN